MNNTRTKSVLFVDVIIVLFERLQWRQMCDQPNMEPLLHTSLFEIEASSVANRERQEAGADAGGGLKPVAQKSHTFQQGPHRQSPTEPSQAPVVPAPLMPFPFFKYQNFSTEEDKDPRTPLTAIGRVPTFPAKLHAILLRPDLRDVVAWLPHGRSWKVLNSKEFEKRVLSVYFEFTKHPHSSFFRQAKLWGFQRMKREGPDRDSYYHPRFLRGLPHLCKDLKRPRKLPDDHDDHEPDLGMISKMYPVPENNAGADATINLDWFLRGRSTAYPSTLIPKGTSSKPPAVKSRKRSKDAQKAKQEDNCPADLEGGEDDEVLYDDLGLNLDPFLSYGFDLDPFFDYQEYSTEEDPDPLTPLTAVGCVPSFPAKLHAILIRTDLSDVVTWLPHGRSWKVLNTQEFEKRVIPMYFEFTNNHVSSFLREVESWGFRRLKGEGPDRDSYYHPRFLRGLPHLCKDLKRVPNSAALPLPTDDDDDAEPAEPDLGNISELFPVPDYYE